MKIEVARILVDAANDLDIDARLYEGYSGRGMYGKKTDGVVVDRFSSIAVLAAQGVVRIMRNLHDDYSEDDVMEFVDDIRRLSSDSMGRGVIIY